jgi:hypothetical protein
MLSRLSRIWKNKTPRSRRTICLAVVALTHLSVITVAGIFSSRITLAGDQVLARGTTCGWIANGTSLNNPGQDTLVATYEMGRWTAINALEYARDCYNVTSLADSGSCGLYTLPAINLTTINHVPCPFSEDICGLPYAIEVDTGLIDSNAHLGINTKPSSRIRFRKVLTCVPILSDRYSSSWESPPTTLPKSDYILGDKFKFYNLGATPPGRFNSTATSVISKYWLFYENPGGYNLAYVRISCSRLVHT